MSLTCRWRISRWSTYATALNTTSEASGPSHRQIDDGSSWSFVTAADTPGAPSLPRQRLVLDAMGLNRFVSLTAFVVFRVFLIVAFEPDDLRVAFESQDVGGDTIEEPAIVRDDDRA